jgi:hypothetical protein
MVKVDDLILDEKELWVAACGEAIGTELAWRAEQYGSPPTMAYMSSAVAMAIAQAQIDKIKAHLAEGGTIDEQK